MKFEYKNNNLILKVLTSEYADEVLNFYKRNREYFDRYETDKPDNFYTREFIRNLLTAEYNAFVAGKNVRFFLFDVHKPHQIIGTVSFSDIKTGSFLSCHIGYKIDHAFWRMGYGRRMVTTALNIMVTKEHMHRIEAYISPDNAPSIALATQIGFIPEGTAYSYVNINGKWQDHLRYVYIDN
jgi:ribosomal-protein-alanine N-acetyltransferase